MSINISDGMNYAPQGKPQPVVKPGEFVFSAAALDHGHIYGMTNGLLEAGGTLKYVYDRDPKKVEAFLKQYPQAKAARSRIANDAHPEYPELDDFGDCAIIGAKGTTNYFRVDWFNPDGLRTWGDGRTFILGTEGYIEIRKYINVAGEKTGGNHVYLVNGKGEQYVDATGVTDCPFFGWLILDCLNRTETAVTQHHAFKTAELCLQAQAQAIDVTRA